MRAHLDNELVPHYLLRELSESIQYLHPPATNKEYSQCKNRRCSNPIGEFGSCIIFSILGIFTWEFGFSCLAKPSKYIPNLKRFWNIFSKYAHNVISKVGLHYSHGRGVLLIHELCKLLSLISIISLSYYHPTTTLFP